MRTRNLSRFFDQLLAGDAVAAPRQSFETFRINFLSTVKAFAVASVANSRQRGVNAFDYCAFMRAQAQKDIFVVRDVCPVSFVNAISLLNCSARLLSLRQAAEQFRATSFQRFL